MRALVVDDSPIMHRVLARMLTQLGFTVSEASDGASGVARVRAERPDLILLDWPQHDGFAFLVAVRAESDLGKVPVLMITSQNDSSHIPQALRAGVTDYLLKPFDAAYLAAKLARLGLGVPHAASGAR